MNKIDCFGDMCPVPLLRLQSALKKMCDGEELQIVVDHSCVVGSIDDYYEKTKHLLTITEAISGVWEINVIKNYFLLNPKSPL